MACAMWFLKQPNTGKIKCRRICCTTFEIRTIEAPDNKTGDAPILPELMGQIPETEIIAANYGDGPYDTKECHNTIAAIVAAR